MPCSTSWRTNCAPPNSTAPSVERRARRPAAEGLRRAMPNSPESAEDRLIARYFRPLAKHPGAFGLVDDAAVITPPPGCDVVLTTDGVISGVHVFPDDRPEDIGRKALRMNLSDLAAKGATPLGFLLSLALPATIDEAWLAAFAGGLGEDAERYGCPLLGGDTDRTPGPMSVSIAAFGAVPHGKMVRRSTAKAGRRDRRDRHHRRRRARRAAAAGRKPRQAVAVVGSDERASQATLSLARAAQCAGQCGSAKRLGGDRCVRRPRRRSRQALPCVRRRRRDRCRARAAVRSGPRCDRRRSSDDGNGAQRRRRLRDRPDAGARQTRRVPRGGAPGWRRGDRDRPHRGRGGRPFLHEGKTLTFARPSYSHF